MVTQKRRKIFASVAAVAVILGATALIISRNEVIARAATEEKRMTEDEFKYSYVTSYKDFDFGLKDFIIDDLENGVVYSNVMYVPISPGAISIGAMSNATYRCNKSYVGTEGVFGYFGVKDFDYGSSSYIYFNCRDANDGYGIQCPAELVGRDVGHLPFVTVGDYCYFTVGDLSYFSIYEAFTFTELALGFERCFFLDSAVDYITRIQEYGKLVQERSYEYGYSVGSDAGYLKGHDVGYNLGYKSGVIDEKNNKYVESEFTLEGLIWQILDAPFTLLNNTLDFNVFGINLAKAIKVIISLMIVGVVIKVLL